MWRGVPIMVRLALGLPCCMREQLPRNISVLYNQKSSYHSCKFCTHTLTSSLPPPLNILSTSQHMTCLCSASTVTLPALTLPPIIHQPFPLPPSPPTNQPTATPTLVLLSYIVRISLHYLTGRVARKFPDHTSGTVDNRPSKIRAS